MSKGLGKIQRTILDQLSGRSRGSLYTGAVLTTAELTDNLQAAGILPEDKRKIAAFQVYRACLGLYHRKLIQAERVWDEDHHVKCWTWTAAYRDDPSGQPPLSITAPVEPTEPHGLRQTEMKGPIK